jgi:tryptophan synthase beta chain
MSETARYMLDQSDLPTAWYNILADMPTPPTPVLHPGTKEPVTPDFLSALFPMPLIEQEMSSDRYVDIPDDVREIYKLWRPTPLHRARRLERALDTPAHIYFKYEGGSPTGSHKPNTAVAQAYFNRVGGTRALTTETGAGQWGSALAFACSTFDLALEVYMVRVSYEQKPYRRMMMESFGAEVYASPTDKTAYGRSVRDQNADSPGSLGIAISEAVEVAASSGGAKKYALGSVLNHVLMHQTVIGEEALKQMDLAGEYPDVVIGCAGGGSNFAGLAFPFLRHNLRDDRSTRILAVEPTAAPTLTRGTYAFDFGDSAMMAPIVKMHTLGHGFVPAPIHAGGLRYHGMSPTVSALYDGGLIDAVAVPQLATFEAALTFARAEGILPAPEPSHAIKVAIDEALDAKAKGESRVILFNLCGHGHFDLAAYDAYLQGQLVDYEYPPEEVAEAMAALPVV